MIHYVCGFTTLFVYLSYRLHLLRRRWGMTDETAAAAAGSAASRRGRRHSPPGRAGAAASCSQCGQFTEFRVIYKGKNVAENLPVARGRRRRRRALLQRGHVRREARRARLGPGVRGRRQRVLGGRRRRRQLQHGDRVNE